MPVVECPACHARMSVADDQVGRPVRCPRCKGVFTSSASRPVAPPARSRAANPPPRMSSPVVVEDDDYDNEDIDEVAEARARRGRVTRTKVALILMFIGQCCTFAALAFASLFLILIWASAGPTEHRVFIIGVPGLVGWMVSAVGCGFAVSGIQKQNALGLSIALASVAAVHLLLLFIVVFAGDGASTRSADFGPMSFGRRAFSGQQKPLQHFDTALPYAITSFGLFAQKLEAYAIAASAFSYQWDPFASFVRYGFLPVLAGFCELARWILLALWLRSIARVSRAPDMENGALGLVIGVPAMIGAFFVFNFIISVLPSPTTQGGGKALVHTMIALQFLGLIGILAATVWAGVVTLSLRRLVRERTPGDASAKRR